MTATTESSNQAPNNGKPKRKRRAWQPDAKDHLIYQWVKFDGKTQLHTAAEFGISQATVSRIIDRYERWQAHADPREGGRLDPAERLRAQRWLTYERNELIVASALRIADRMEGVTESWKSVRTKPLRDFFKEGTEIRSEERSVDRHGVAARFLRLAFRVNMEQLKLVEQDPPPLPEALSAKELAEEEQRDAVVAEDLAAAERRAEERSAAREREHEAEIAGTKPEVVQVVRGSPDPAQDATAGLACEGEGDLRSDGGAGSGDPRPAESSQPEDPEHNLHKVHNGETPENAVTPDRPCTCAADREIQKTADDACIPATSHDDSAWPALDNGNGCVVELHGVVAPG
jgi:hypothetical protein